MSTDTPTPGVQPAGDAAPLRALREIQALLRGPEGTQSPPAFRALQIANRALAGDAVPMVDPAPVAWKIDWPPEQEDEPSYTENPNIADFARKMGRDVTPLYAAPAGDVPRQDLGDSTQRAGKAMQRPADALEQWLQGQEFHELCLDYRGACLLRLQQAAFEALQAAILRVARSNVTGKEPAAGGREQDLTPGFGGAAQHLKGSEQ